jgi:serine protease
MKNQSKRAYGLAFALAALLAGSASHAAQPVAGSVGGINVSALHSGGSYERFIVKYRAGSAEAGSRDAVKQHVGAALGRSGLVAKAGAKAAAASAAPEVTYLRKTASGADVVRTRKLDKDQAMALMRQIAADPDVVHVEPDVMMHAIADFRAPAKIAADFIPNDPYYAGYQWHLRPGDGTAETVGSDATSYSNRGGADISRAWNLADGSGITVAVLDTGITHHPDLDTSLGGAGYDFISDSFVSGRPTDDRVPGGWDLGDWTTEDPWLSECTDSQNPPEASSWHGSHVSGTIAEMTNNGVGMAGSAFGAKVLPVRVLGHCGGYTSDIADAIEWASGGHVDGVPDNTHPAQVISMSLGGSGVCSATDVTGQAIADAISRGTTVVVAAGNSDDDASFYSPASCPGAIAVASVGITGKRAFYSNFGTTVALAAPGGGIYPNDGTSGNPIDAGFVWSTVNGSATAPDENDYVYGGMAGTSQATPHVTGTVALVAGALQAAGKPALSPADMKALLTSTARPFPNTPDQVIGTGIVDAYAAVSKAVGGDNGGGGDNATVLNNGDTLAVPAGNAGDQQLYKIDVPSGVSALVLRTYGGSGDVSLYVKHDAAPTASDFDRSSIHAGNNESVVITRPAAATYYLLVSGVQAFSGLSVQASYTAPAK